MDIRFDGKVAMVTAGGSGIGRAAAQALGAAGARVLVADIAEATGADSAAALRAAGADALFRRTDLTDEADVAAMVAAAVARWGTVDVLVNAVGGGAAGDRPALLHEIDIALMRETLDRNVTTAAMAMKHVLPVMIRGGRGGAIVSVSSGAGLQVVREATVGYSLGKAALIHLTRLAAVTYGEHNIRVNAVAPGPTLTPMLLAGLTREQIDAVAGTAPIPRALQPSEPAAAIVWLASDHAAMVTGHVVPVDGGATAV